MTDSRGPQGSAAFIWTVTPVIVPASGPALVYTGYTADNPDVGDTSFTDFSGATGQDADVVDTLPDTLSGYRCAVLAVNTYFSDSDISTLQAFLNAGGRSSLSASIPEAGSTKPTRRSTVWLRRSGPAGCR